MKILFCIPTLEYGGAERQLSYLSTELARSGHDVHVAFGRGGPLAERMPVTLHNLDVRGSHDPRLPLRLVRLMRRLKPDVVQTCLPQMDVAAGAAALLTRAPWVLREPSAAPAYPRGWKTWLRRRLAMRANAIVSNSQNGDAYWRDAGARRRHVIQNAIPFAEIDAIASIEPDRPTLLFAGRMDEAKNAAAVLEAAGIVAREMDVAAIFCGDGPQRRALEGRAHDLGLDGRVTFPGYAADLFERMKRASAVVSLSRYEGSPNVVTEAMACGTPLVVSDIAAHREILDETSALFAPPDDPADAAAAIRATLLERDAAQARARRARGRVEGWTIEALSRAYVDVFHRVR